MESLFSALISLHSIRMAGINFSLLFFSSSFALGYRPGFFCACLNNLLSTIPRKRFCLIPIPPERSERTRVVPLIRTRSSLNMVLVNLQFYKDQTDRCIEGIVPKTFHNMGKSNLG